MCICVPPWHTGPSRSSSRARPIETVPVLEKPAPMTWRVQSGSLLGFEATPPILIASGVPFHPGRRSSVCMHVVLLPQVMMPSEPSSVQIDFIPEYPLSRFRQSGNFPKEKLKVPIGLHFDTRAATGFESFVVLRVIHAKCFPPNLLGVWPAYICLKACF